MEKGYRWLLKQGYSPKDIIIAGDSAGGGLSLALTLKLKMNISQHPNANFIFPDRFSSKWKILL